MLRLLLQLQEHCSAKLDKPLDISTPLTIVGDSFSAGQFKFTSRGIQKLMHGIDVNTANIAAHIDSQQTEHINKYGKRAPGRFVLTVFTLNFIYATIVG